MSLEGGVPRAAAIYCRISDDRAGTALGVARQEADCRALADRKGWPVADLYVDNDISAADRRKRRPEYERLLGDLKAGAVDAVIVWDLDRLHRRPLELERFFEIADAAGVQKLASVAGDVDLGSGEGLLLARIKGAVAADEVAKIKRRVRRKHDELAESGAVSGGGARPFGFEEDRLTIRESEAVVLREAMRRVLAGESSRSVCADLNERGVRTSVGNPWSTSVLTRLLSSARVCGQRERNGEAYAAQWPAIVSPAEVAAFRALRKEKASSGRRVSRGYLLSGLVVCEACGARMVSRPRNDGVRRYVCASGPGFSGCGKTYVVAEPLEDLITEAVLVRLDKPEFAKSWNRAEQQADGSGIAAAIDDDELQLDELATAYGQKLVSLREYLKARAPIEARLEAARKRLAASTGPARIREFVGHGEQLRDVWDGLDITRRQAIIGGVLERVTIGPGVRGRARFDGDRVTPTWRY